MITYLECSHPSIRVTHLGRLFHHLTYHFNHSSPTASSKFCLKCWIFNFGRVFQTHFVTEWSYYARWRDNISVAEVFFKSAKDEVLCCLRESPQPKVNSAKSICHGLHGCKIKNFFLFKVHSGFTPMAVFLFPRAFFSSRQIGSSSKKERSPLAFVALWRGYFGFHWNGTESPEMSPIRKVWVLISKPDLNTSSPNPLFPNSGEVCVSLD